MFERVMMIGILGISVVTMLPTGAMAYNIQGTPIIVQKDIDCISIVTGIQPVDKADAVVVCSITIKEVTAQCQTPGGQGENAKGKPFTPVVVSSSQTEGDFEPLTEKGKAVSTVRILQADIEAALGGEICQNANWLIVPGTAAVTKLGAEITLFSGAEGGCATGGEAG